MVFAWFRKCDPFICRPHSSESRVAAEVVLLDSTVLSSRCGYLPRSWLFLATFIFMVWDLGCSKSLQYHL